jgi:hypothetical protein
VTVSGGSDGIGAAARGADVGAGAAEVVGAPDVAVAETEPLSPPPSTTPVVATATVDACLVVFRLVIGLVVSRVVGCVIPVVTGRVVVLRAVAVAVGGRLLIEDADAFGGGERIWRLSGIRPVHVIYPGRLVQYRA